MTTGGHEADVYEKAMQRTHERYLADSKEA